MVSMWKKSSKMGKGMPCKGRRCASAYALGMPVMRSPWLAMISNPLRMLRKPRVTTMAGMRR
ncbi:MAG: hypothetical protein KatS3mg051_0220 [Anaerolineae bacterium]|nr:MAG: hypothetical protein KatS3mg051_0220 [Anaerolineae bacterium]